MASCPFANPRVAVDVTKGAQGCPFHAHHVPASFTILSDAEINTVKRGGTHLASQDAANLLRDIGGCDRIREFCTRFYAHAFEDTTINVFFFQDDGAEAHGKRLADWIIEKLDPSLSPWTDSGRLGQRQPSHSAAWNNSKRPLSDRGKHFDLKDSRIWMRLHFWGLRECGLMEHRPFLRYYMQFIQHFISIYEREAPAFVMDSVEWSASEENIQAYLTNGHVMSDVLHHRGRGMLHILKEGLTPRL